MDAVVVLSILGDAAVTSVHMALSATDKVDVGISHDFSQILRKITPILKERKGLSPYLLLLTVVMHFNTEHL